MFKSQDISHHNEIMTSQANIINRLTKNSAVIVEDTKSIAIPSRKLNLDLAGISEARAWADKVRNGNA